MNSKILPTNQEISNTLQQKTNNNERGSEARKNKRDIGKSEDNNHRNKSNYDSKNRNIKKSIKKSKAIWKEEAIKQLHQDAVCKC